MPVNRKGYFKTLRKTRFEDLFRDETITLPESDLCFQNDQYIIQMQFHEPEEGPKYEIHPGTYMITQTGGTVSLEKMELRRQNLLPTVMNTELIIKEARTFFSRLHVYEELQQPKKRGVLLFSKPGMGKTSAIIKFCEDAIAEEPGTVVINWPTSEVEADEVAKFLSVRSEYVDTCKRLVLIIEDIGGGEREGHHGPRGIDSSLLNLLDGVDMTFKLPTFIIATTNHPENLLEALADRPGRFDLMLQLDPPCNEEKVTLVEFIAKRSLTDEEKKAVSSSETADFSIAHLKEVVIRSKLHDKSLQEVIRELVNHKKQFHNSFEDNKKGNLGFQRGGGWDD